MSVPAKRDLHVFAIAAAAAVAIGCRPRHSIIPPIGPAIGDDARERNASTFPIFRVLHPASGAWGSSPSISADREVAAMQPRLGDALLLFCREAAALCS